MKGKFPKCMLLLVEMGISMFNGCIAQLSCFQPSHKLPMLVQFQPSHEMAIMVFIEQRYSNP